MKYNASSPCYSCDQNFYCIQNLFTNSYLTKENLNPSYKACLCENEKRINDTFDCLDLALNGTCEFENHPFIFLYTILLISEPSLIINKSQQSTTSQQTILPLLSKNCQRGLNEDILNFIVNCT
ncbi:hypothetical protein HDU92_004210 [Lobulomyces angularis]|nr:hypothetical protein HDU92_004210 [Lobulomyces angularis]